MTWHVSPLFAAQGADQAFEFAIKQGEAGLKLHRVFGVVRLLDLQIDGVLIQRWLGRHAITQSRICRRQRLAIKVLAVAAAELKLAALGLGILLGQYRSK